MTKHIALLRGINVGGNKKVSMAKLKELFQSLGFQNVSTYINSGNVLFESDEKSDKKLVSIIEQSLFEHFGFEIQVVVRSLDEIKKIAKAIPETWQNNTEQRTDILFLWEDFDNKKTLDLIQQTVGVDTLIYTKGAIIWHFDRKHYTKSSMHKFIGTTVYKKMTARNVNTVRKLLKLSE